MSNPTCTNDTVPVSSGWRFDPVRYGTCGGPLTEYERQMEAGRRVARDYAVSLRELSRR